MFKEIAREVPRRAQPHTKQGVVIPADEPKPSKCSC